MSAALAGSQEVLALPYKAFNASDVLIGGKRIIAVSMDRRQTSSQLDGDTGTNTVWDGAIVLAKFLQQINICRNSRVLELGGGSGFLAVACRLLGALEVTVSDLGYVKKACEAMITANSVTNVRFSVLDWNQPEESGIDPSAFDLVLASDVVWLKHLLLPFLKTINWLFESNSKLVMYLAHQNRSEKCSSQFFSGVENMALQVEDVTSHADSSSMLAAVRVYRITHGGNRS